MTKRISAAILIVCGFSMQYGAATAAEPEVPEPFRGFDEASELTISYEDLSSLLRAVVVDAGNSTRAIADPVQAKTGTRMKPRIERYTASEGNRFFYETFTDNEAGRDFLRKIQKSLEALPAEEPLEKFSRNEQLAYWLNLYNVTVLNEIVAVYPKRNLKRLLLGKNSILEQKLLTVAGVPLSLNDIQFTILTQNYDYNPLIIYGLYQGIIGGPDIRKFAYSGDNVYYDLEDNAFKFVNSNRGTFNYDEGILLVSNWYERNSVYFPDFDSDLSKHLMDFVEGEERAGLLAASMLKPTIDDWTVTDLGGTRQEVARSLAHNNAALLDAYRGNRRSVNGGIRVASIITRHPTVDPRDDDVDEDREDSDRVGSLGTGTTPVEGASVEDVMEEETEPTE